MKIEDIKRAVQGKKIILNNKLIALKTFGRLLSFLKIDSILFENAEVADIEMGVSILGKASFGSFQFKDSECCIYKNEQIESGYEIEWYGKMASIQLSKLNLPGISSFSRLLPTPLQEMSFGDPTFLYESQNETLVTKSLWSNHQIDFPSVYLIFKNLGLFLEWDIPSEKLSRCLLTASMEVGKTPVIVELQLPAGKSQPLWSMILSEEFTLENGINDLAAFLSKQDLLKPLLGGGKMEEILPDAVKQFKGLCISEFEMLFNPLRPAIYSISTTLSYYTNWTLFGDFTLTDIGLSVFITFHGKNAATTLRLFGRFSFIENWYVEFSFELPLDKKGDWLIRLEGYADLKNLMQLESFKLFTVDSLNIPPEWLMVKDIRLNKFEMVFNPIDGMVKSVEFAVALTAESSIVPGIKVRNPELELKLSF